jgi:hypothetical protein
MAESLCIFCGKPIGYETRFYESSDGFMHAQCEEERVDRVLSQMA